ncbi:hypothetical protein [Providencia rettgeri]|uniref:hypothetical protein n=1 Tax=Providencia rettgeri TaxID=587 RepID=UPI0035237A96
MAKDSAERKRDSRKKLLDQFEGGSLSTICLTQESKYALSCLRDYWSYPLSKNQTEQNSYIINELILRLYIDSHHLDLINKDKELKKMYNAYIIISENAIKGKSFNHIKELLLKNNTPLPTEFKEWTYKTIIKLTSMSYILKKMKVIPK